MRIMKRLVCCLFSLVMSGAILYGDLLFSFPSEITMFQNQSHNTALGAGVYIGNIPDDICTWDSKKGVIPLESGSFDATLKLANAIPFRKIRLNVTEPQKVYASGELVGLRIYNNGLIVTQTESFSNGKKSISPASEAGICEGDIILEINGVKVTDGSNVSKLLKDTTTVTVLRNNSLKKFTVHPVRDITDGNLRLGVWVRDSTAGIGTLTYYNTENKTYGALGHPVSDSDTGILFDVKSGNIEKSSVMSINKGVSGKPGEICGRFSGEDGILGTVETNCEAGIFGTITSSQAPYGTLYPVGVMSQVTEGKATILSTVDDTVKEYEIKILRSMPFGSATKGMMIEVTDPELLSKTGGIVQGMSGSPIIQNGKIIGAVTHVLVNDPTRGYGIFIENMLSEAG